MISNTWMLEIFTFLKVSPKWFPQIINKTYAGPYYLPQNNLKKATDIFE